MDKAVRASRRTASSLRRTSRGSRSSSGSVFGYRYKSGIRKTAERYTTSDYYRSANRFSYNPSTKIYTYGTYRGSRFGGDIKRTVYWPVYGLFLGTRYNRADTFSPPAENSNIYTNSSVVISDSYIKTEHTTQEAYDCTLPSNTSNKITCYESIPDQSITSTIYESDEDFYFDDGGCCEDGSQNPVCCIIALNKSIAIKGILFTFFSLTITSVLLAFKICR